MGIAPDHLQTIRALMTVRPAAEQAWEGLLGRDVHLRIGSRPTAVGRDEALLELNRLLERVDSFGVAFEYDHAVGELVVIETDIRGRSEGAEVVPCAILARLTTGLIRDLRFYLDPTSLQLRQR